MIFSSNGGILRQSRKLALYVVCYNQWIREMVTMPVTTLEDLAKIKGFGERRVKKYGDQILKIMEIYQKMG